MAVQGVLTFIVQGNVSEEDGKCLDVWKRKRFTASSFKIDFIENVHAFYYKSSIGFYCWLCACFQLSIGAFGPNSSRDSLRGTTHWGTPQDLHTFKGFFSVWFAPKIGTLKWRKLAVGIPMSYLHEIQLQQDGGHHDWSCLLSVMGFMLILESKRRRVLFHYLKQKANIKSCCLHKLPVLHQCCIGSCIRPINVHLCHSRFFWCSESTYPDVGVKKVPQNGILRITDTIKKG